MVRQVGPGVLAPREISGRVVAVDPVVTTDGDLIVRGFQHATGAHLAGVVVVDGHTLALDRLAVLSDSCTEHLIEAAGHVDPPSRRSGHTRRLRPHTFRSTRRRRLSGLARPRSTHTHVTAPSCSARSERNPTTDGRTTELVAVSRLARSDPRS